MTNATSADDRKIAIIGMSCRFPGANNPDEYWQLLAQEKDLIRPVPESRWQLAGLYDKTPGQVGKLSSRWGGFVDDIDQFDAAFFNISRREANAMDPQQRLMLQLAWHALESANINAKNLAGSRSGIYIGASTWDYNKLFNRDINILDAYVGAGTSLSILANRISYFLDFKGPSLVVDTACSSSLVALNLAMQNLVSGETDLALSGGVNIILSPETTCTFSAAGFMSGTGRCKSFSADADGYVRSEGAGFVVLKRLQDALNDGDPILGTLLSCAVNQDGQSNGLTAPNGLSQQSVIRQAQQQAEIHPSQISYIETHGTGTPLGDPIEVRALNVVLNTAGSSAPCALGAAKANIGHAEAAAGMAGLLKILLALKNQKIPAQLHCENLNPQVESAIKDSRLFIPKSLIPWERSDKTRIAGLSSFGFGGTNAHAIVQEAPKEIQHTESIVHSAENKALILKLSAQSPSALAALVKQYQQKLSSYLPTKLTNDLPIDMQSISDFCHSNNINRQDLNYRHVVTAQNQQQLKDNLALAINAPIHKRLGRLKMVFMFTGQGCQYVDMGKQLYQQETVFKQALDECQYSLPEYWTTTLTDILFGPEAAQYQKTTAIQPALFAYEYALYQLFLSWGIKPAALVGHSLGEYVACCVAGVFSLKDALTLVCGRARMMSNLPGDGTMLALSCDKELAQQLLNQLPDHASAHISIATANSPTNTVVAGTRYAIDLLTGLAREQNLPSSPLAVSHAFHSPLVKPMLDEFYQLAQSIKYQAPKIKIVNNLYASQTEDCKIFNAKYFTRHTEQTVLFSASIITLMDAGFSHFIEIGPKSVLTSLVKQHSQFTLQKNALAINSQQGASDELQQLYQATGQIYQAGANINWQFLHQSINTTTPLNRAHKARLNAIQLPPYPFTPDRHWLQYSDKPRAMAADNQQSYVSDSTPQKIEVTGMQNYTMLWRTIDQGASKRNEALTSTCDDLSILLLIDNSNLSSEREVHSAPKNKIVNLIEAFAQQGKKTKVLSSQDVQSFITENELLVKNKKEIVGIINLLPLDSMNNKENFESFDGVKNSSNLQQSLLLSIELLQTAQQQAIPLWFISQQGQQVNAEDSININQAGFWGLARTAALEIPQIWNGIIDIDELNTTSSKLLVQEVINPSQQKQLALRNGQIFSAHLSHQPLPTSQSLPALMQTEELDGCHLIIGGLGALGLQLTQSLVAAGVKYLVLCSRQPRQAIKQIQTYRRQGVTIRLLETDITQLSQVQAAMKIAHSMAPLKVVYHCAGSLNDASLANIDQQKLQQVLSPKYLGSWNLHLASKEYELNNFVLFSSAAAILGSPGQAHYAAANATMDGLAQWRVQHGLPALSINWGPWQGGGMASTSLNNTHLKHQLDIEILTPLPAQKACQVLLQLLKQHQQGQVGIIDINWSLLVDRLPVRQVAHLSGYLSNNTVKKISDHSEKESILLAKGIPLLDELLSLDSPQRIDFLNTHLQNLIANALQISTEKINLDDELAGQLLDSLLTTEIIASLQQELKIPLNARDFFQYPSINLLSVFIEKLLSQKIPESQSRSVNLTKPSANNCLDIDDELQVNDKELWQEQQIKLREQEICISRWPIPLGKIKKDKPSIILLHGILEQGPVWHPVASALAHQGYDVIAPDLRGHGLSSHNQPGHCYQLLHYLADLSALIESLNLSQPPILVGHSLGSQIAALYSATYPDKVASLILVETLLPKGVDLLDMQQQLLTELEHIQKRKPHPILKNLDHAQQLMSINHKKMPEFLVNILCQRVSKQHHGGLIWRWDPLLRSQVGLRFHGRQTQYLELLQKVSCPSYLLFGQQSRFYNKNQQQLIQQAMPTANVQELAGSHNLHIDQYAKVIDTLLESVKSINMQGSLYGKKSA